MEGYCSTGQSPQWAVVPMEEEEEEEGEEEEEEEEGGGGGEEITKESRFLFEPRTRHFQMLVKRITLLPTGLSRHYECV